MNSQLGSCEKQYEGMNIRIKKINLKYRFIVFILNATQRLGYGLLRKNLQDSFRCS